MIRWLVLFLTLSTSAFCQQLIEGTIVDKDTGKPVPFASIGIVGTSKGTSSNLNGQFSISISEPVLLQVTCIGYETLKIYSLEVVATPQVQLKPMVTQLADIVIFDKPVKAKKLVQKVFAHIPDNYNDQPFLQKFFYRHYCKDDEEYGRLIEASVDVWKNKGYKWQQKSAGDDEQIRITQLRRSLDQTVMAQGHEPIAVGNILQADLIGYQAAEQSEHMSFYSTMSNLKIDMDSYVFNLKGITSYDGQEVYEITYVYKKDSVLTTSGDYRIRAQATGSLFITTDSYAIIKAEEVRTYAKNTTRISAYYRRYAGLYYPYHFIIDGESIATDKSKHAFHIELMSVEIKKDKAERFEGQLPGREELLNIPYDSVFWTSSTVLKTTPLEDDIIRDLGGGTSLNKQFYRYQQYEMNVRDGGVNGEAKFNWFREDSRGNRILYVILWSGNLQANLVEFELAKRLNKQYRNKVTFLFISLDDDENLWKQMVQKYNLNADGIINYRVGSHSQLAKDFGIKRNPSFVLLARNGEVFSIDAKSPSNPLLQEDLTLLVDHK